MTLTPQPHCCVFLFGRAGCSRPIIWSNIDDHNIQVHMTTYSGVIETIWSSVLLVHLYPWSLLLWLGQPPLLFRWCKSESVCLFVCTFPLEIVCWCWALSSHCCSISSYWYVGIRVELLAIVTAGVSEWVSVYILSSLCSWNHSENFPWLDFWVSWDDCLVVQQPAPFLVAPYKWHVHSLNP